MKLRMLAVLLLLCSAAFAAETSAPSEASIKQLLEVMQVHKNVDALMGQMDTLMKNAFQQAMQAQPPPAEAQKAFDKCRTEVVTMLKEHLTWDKLEPMYIRIYQKSFTQDEVNGIIGFYKTPTGQAVVSKLPVVMQNTMQETMTLMRPMMQRVQAMQQEIVAKAQATKPKTAVPN